MTANTFCITCCTVGVVFPEICQILSENISPQLMKFAVSKHDVSGTTSHFFQQYGFPQVISCIDGSHKPIKNQARMRIKIKVK